MPEASPGDEIATPVRWDKRLEAARARRAEILSQKRARGDAPSQALLSRRPWEDEATGVLPTELPQRSLPGQAVPRTAPLAAEPSAPADAAAPAKSEQAAKAPSAPDAVEPADPPAKVSAEPLLLLTPEVEAEPRRLRWGLAAGFLLGGLAAAGALLFMPGDRTPTVLPSETGTGVPVATTPADAGSPVQGEESVVETVPAAPLPEPPTPTEPTVAAGEAVAAGSVVAEPEATAPETVGEASPDPTPPDLAPPADIDFAALEAIALGAVPETGRSDLLLGSGAEDRGGRAPRGFAPQPLMSPADPVLAGLGVRAQRQGPSMPDAASRARLSDVSGVVLPDAPRAARATALAVVPALAGPGAPDAAAGAPALSPRPEVAAAAALTDVAPETGALGVDLPRPVASVPPSGAPAVLAAAAPDVTPAPSANPPVRPRPIEPAPADEQAQPELTPPAATSGDEITAQTAPADAAAEPVPVPEPATSEPAPLDSTAPAEATSLPPSDEAPSDAPPEAGPPPRAEAVLVHILVPEGTAPGRAEDLSAAVRALGYDRRTPAEVGVTIRETQVRYYYPEDAEAARLVAGAVGGPARDFTGFRPQPPEGTIEVWLAGEAPPPPPPPQPVVRARPVTPPPPPQPQGYCWRGEPGAPGSLRVPIVDGRCAWP